jgi:phosphatidylserine/phosphatidylglycerophosphate/cardiolipin synthase-like enzyme
MLAATLWLICASAILLALALSCCSKFRRRERQEVFFFPDHHGEHVARVCAEIDQARRRVWLAMFVLTDDLLSSAVLRAKRRGVDVRLLLDGEQFDSMPGADGPRLEEAGVRVVRAHVTKASGGQAHMHHKFVVLDGVVLSGSFNWTWQASHSNCENLCLLRDRALVRDFAQEFLTLWRDFGGGHRGGRLKTRQEEELHGRKRRDRTPGAGGRGGG